MIIVDKKLHMDYFYYVTETVNPLAFHQRTVSSPSQLSYSTTDRHLVSFYT